MCETTNGREEIREGGSDISNESERREMRRKTKVKINLLSRKFNRSLYGYFHAHTQADTHYIRRKQVFQQYVFLYYCYLSPFSSQSIFK